MPRRRTSFFDYPKNMELYRRLSRELDPRNKENVNSPELNPFYRQLLFHELFNCRGKSGPKVLITGGESTATLDFVSDLMAQARFHKRQGDSWGAIVFSDVSSESVRQNRRKHFRGGRKMFFAGDVRALGLSGKRKNRFDVIVTDNLLDYLGAKDKEHALREWNRVLKNGGKVITTFGVKLPKGTFSTGELDEHMSKIKNTNPGVVSLRSALKAAENESLAGPFNSMKELSLLLAKTGFRGYIADNLGRSSEPRVVQMPVEKAEIGSLKRLASSLLPVDGSATFRIVLEKKRSIFA